MSIMVMFAVLVTNFHNLESSDWRTRQEASRYFTQDFPKDNLPLLSYLIAEASSSEQRYRLTAALRYRMVYVEDPIPILASTNPIIQSALGKRQTYIEDFLEVRGVKFNKTDSGYKFSFVLDTPIDLSIFKFAAELDDVSWIQLQGKFITDEFLKCIGPNVNTLRILDADISDAAVQAICDIPSLVNVYLIRCPRIDNEAMAGILKFRKDSAGYWMFAVFGCSLDVETNLNIIKTLAERNRVAGYLSWDYRPPGKQLPFSMASQGNKVTVTAVLGGPLQYQDVILEANGHACETPEDVWRIVQDCGDSIKLKIQSFEEEGTQELTVDLLPDSCLK